MEIIAQNCRTYNLSVNLFAILGTLAIWAHEDSVFDYGNDLNERAQFED